MVVIRRVSVNIIAYEIKISSLLHSICYHEHSVTVTAVKTGVRMNHVCVLPMLNTEAGWNGVRGNWFLNVLLSKHVKMNSTISAKSYCVYYRATTRLMDSQVRLH